MIPDFSEQGQLVYKVVKIKEKEMGIFCKISEVSRGCGRGMWETVPGAFNHVKEQSEKAPQKSWYLVCKMKKQA